MAILSVDLAYRYWSDLGIVILGGAPAAPDSNPRCNETIACEILPAMAPGLNSDLTPGPTGPVDANLLAGRLSHLCGVRDIRVMMLSGPQAWKSRSNGLEHARVSERQLNRVAKTGLPGLVKPATCRPYAEFCMDVYDALCRRGWRRLQTQDHPGSAQDQRQERILVESCPSAAWKSLGLKPLAAKRRARVSDLAEAWSGLQSLMPIVASRPPNHDQMQAIVAGLPGLALDGRSAAPVRIVGNPPLREDGHWREGFIVLPLPPPDLDKLDRLDRQKGPMGLRWLH